MPYKCKSCPTRFEAQKLLKQHVSSEHKLSCELCGKQFTAQSGLLFHMQQVHDSEDAISCRMCMKVFPTKKKLKEHLSDEINGHKKSMKFICKTCGKCFNAKKYLTQHESVHSDNKKTFTCLTCEKIFSSKQYLKKHEKSHDIPVENNVSKNNTAKADEGSEAVQQKDHNMQEPIDEDLEAEQQDDDILQETTDENLVADQQNDQFLKEATEGLEAEQQNEHILQKIDEVEISNTPNVLPKIPKNVKLDIRTSLPVNCNFCKDKFIDESQLNLHLDIFHAMTNTTMNTECQYCQRSYKSKSTLQVHKKRNHYFICGNCGKIFTKKTLFEKHRAEDHENHIKAKHFTSNFCTCDYCGSNIVTKSACESHNCCGDEVERICEVIHEQ